VSNYAQSVYGELRVNRSVTIPAAELNWRFSHSGGPGGQGVNTADSKAELRFDLATSTAIPEHLRERALGRLEHRLVDGELVVTSSAHRSQLDNRRAAATKLRILLDAAMSPEPPKRRATRPTTASVQRRLDAKRRRGHLKQQRHERGD
jgi:ribosome-associated protein